MAGTKRREVPILTRVESEVMSILWRGSGATVHEVIAQMSRPVAYTSALTVLRILEKKGYVQHSSHPDGSRAHVYQALVPAENARRQHVRDLVERLFGGHSEALLVGLIDDEPISRAELERLRTLIDERLGESAEATSPAPAAERAGKNGGARGR
jgi:predicted transcriptional regulator